MLASLSLLLAVEQTTTSAFLSSSKSKPYKTSKTSVFNDNQNSPDASFFASNPDDKDDKKLGIEVGKMLDPLSPSEAAELKAAATEIINESIASGLDEIEQLRQKMKDELAQSSAARKLESDWNAQQETEKLMGKIDALTDAFLTQTQASRQSTKLVALADRSSAGKSTEVGVWGEIDGMAVTTSGTSSSILGSVMSYSIANAVEKITASPFESKIFIVADTTTDTYANRMMPYLLDQLQRQIPGLSVVSYKPTDELPLGAENAQCVLLFLTSISDPNTMSTSLERLLRRTLPSNGGPVGVPPTQFVAVSSLGTERTNKLPYSMQNLMGGALDNRRRMEETLINLVNKEEEGSVVLDYTICKFGEIKENAKATEFVMRPGDTIDGTTDPQTAAVVLAQAIGIQPAARNSTFACVGTLPVDNRQAILDDAFLRLDGPELLRMDLSDTSSDRSFGALIEYIIEWGHLLGNSGEIVTPMRVVIPPAQTTLKGVTKQSRMQLLFLPTRTGKYYTSGKEERALEAKGLGRAGGIRMDLRQNVKEGGLEFCLETTGSDGKMRVRVKRTNYVHGVIIKEQSESIILNRFKRAMDFWLSTHK